MNYMKYNRSFILSINEVTDEEKERYQLYIEQCNKDMTKPFSPSEFILRQRNDGLTQREGLFSRDSFNAKTHRTEFEKMVSFL